MPTELSAGDTGDIDLSALYTQMQIIRLSGRIAALLAAEKGRARYAILLHRLNSLLTGLEQDSFRESKRRH